MNEIGVLKSLDHPNVGASSSVPAFLVLIVTHAVKLWDWFESKEKCVFSCSAL